MWNELLAHYSGISAKMCYINVHVTLFQLESITITSLGQLVCHTALHLLEFLYTFLADPG